MNPAQPQPIPLRCPLVLFQKLIEALGKSAKLRARPRCAPITELRALRTDRLAHRVPRKTHLTHDHFDRFTSIVLSPYLRNRLHYQHPRPRRS
jgi:hypothetical protein